MPVDLPPTTNTLGMQVICIVTTPPVNPAAPTLAELNAGLFAQCHTYGNIAISPEQSTGTGPAKTCSKGQDTRLGRVTWPAIALPYSVVPQELGTPGAAGNELYEALDPGAYVYAYLALGLDGEETGAFEAGDVISHGFKVQCGEYQGPTASGDDEYAEAQVTSQLAPQGGLQCRNYVVPAA